MVRRSKNEWADEMAHGHGKSAGNNGVHLLGKSEGMGGKQAELLLIRISSSARAGNWGR